MHACESGNEEGEVESIAKKFSNLENTTIIAPTRKDVIDDKTETEEGSYTTTNVNGKQYKDKMGRWLELEKGKIKAAHSGDWHLIEPLRNRISNKMMHIINKVKENITHYKK